MRVIFFCPNATSTTYSLQQFAMIGKLRFHRISVFSKHSVISLRNPCLHLKIKVTLFRVAIISTQVHRVRVSYWIHAQINWASLILKSSAFQLPSSFFYLLELFKQVFLCRCFRTKLLHRMNARIFVRLKLFRFLSKDDVHFVRTDCFHVRRRLIGDCLNCLKLSIHTILTVAIAIRKISFILEIGDDWIDLILVGNLVDCNHSRRLLSLTIDEGGNWKSWGVRKAKLEDLMRMLMTRAIGRPRLRFIVHNIAFILSLIT